MPSDVGAPGWWQRRSWTIDALVIGAFVCWFYSPYLRSGLPIGDFPSYVMGSAVQEELLDAPWSFVSWNPYLMCGRPDIEFTSPFRLLALPFDGLEPVLRLKALVVLFNVLSGLTVYALVRSLTRRDASAARAGQDAALFAGLVYPLLPSHITRTAVHGHVHIPMFYAMLPLILWGLFRLRSGRDLRGVLALGLIIGLALLRDVQRTLLLCVMLGLVLAGHALCGLARRGTSRAARDTRGIELALAFAAAFVLGVAIDSVELINSFVGDPYRGDFLISKAHWLRLWSLDNLYTFFDRNGILGARLSAVSGAFYVSYSRYLGLSLCALAALGALSPRILAETRTRFWLLLSLAPLSIWLSFGERPMAGWLAARWRSVLLSAHVPLAGKLLFGLLALACLGGGLVALERNLGRRNLVRNSLLALTVVGVVLFTAPLPLVQRLFFFLRPLRNPDWFQVTAASCSVLLAAALVLAGLARRFGARRWWPLALGLLTAVAIADLLPYRSHLSSHQEPPEAIAIWRQAQDAVAADGEDFRVLSAELANAYTDLGFVRHRKRLAWDFRAHTAPRRTNAYFKIWHQLLKKPEDSELVAPVAGLANIKYVIDQVDFDTDVAPDRRFRVAHSRGGIRVLENLAYRPLVQAYPTAHLMVAHSRTQTVKVAAWLADHGIALVHRERLETPPFAESFARVYADTEAAANGDAPEGAERLGSDTRPHVERRTFASPPELSWARPRPERLVIETAAAEGFFLVAAESYHPWWTATLDGQPVALLPASYAFMGTHVPAGRHTLELRFRQPPATYVLAGMSVLSTLATVVGLVVLRRRRGGDLLLP